MARRRWIKNRDGRWVRSQDRYRKTWLSTLNRKAQAQAWYRTPCHTCLGEDYWWGWCRLQRCEECERDYQDLTYDYGHFRHWARVTTPRWFRNQLEQEYRAKVRDLMRHERYDDLPTTRRKDAAWLYW